MLRLQRLSQANVGCFLAYGSSLAYFATMVRTRTLPQLSRQHFALGTGV